MKKLLFLSAALLIMLLQVQAQSYNAIFFSQQGERFWLVLNGVRQNDAPETNVKVTGLNAPMYKAKVIFEDKARGEFDKSVYLPEESSEVTYSIKKNKKGEYTFGYVSAVPLAQAPPPAAEQRVVLYTTSPKPPVNQTVTVTEHTTTTYNDPNSDNVNVGIQAPGVGIHVNVNDNTGNMQQSTITTHTSTTYTTTTTTTADPMQPTEPAYVLPGYSGPVGCPIPMGNSDFEGAKNSISSKSFEDSKLTIAKQITDANCLLSSQVKQVMGLFSFEASKLEYAKYAYQHTFDLGNYYQVNDAFTFESSIDDLNNYINSQR